MRKETKTVLALLCLITGCARAPEPTPPVPPKVTEADLVHLRSKIISKARPRDITDLIAAHFDSPAKRETFCRMPDMDPYAPLHWMQSSSGTVLMILRRDNIFPPEDKLAALHELQTHVASTRLSDFTNEPRHLATNALFFEMTVLRNIRDIAKLAGRQKEADEALVLHDRGLDLTKGLIAGKGPLSKKEVELFTRFFRAIG